MSMFICNLLLVGLLALQPAYAQEIQPDINNQNVQISKQERVLEPTSSVDNAQNTSEKEITVSDDKLELEPEDLKSKEETSGQDSFVSSSDDEEPPPPVVPKPPTVDPYKLLKGLVGSQETNLFTGAAGYQWQVPLPAGRQGLTPQLHLQYSSDMRMFDSLVGYGWMFDAGSIFRSTEQGKNNLYNNPHFSISQDGGTQELVLLNDAAQTYATRYGQDYRLYSFANNTWVVTHTNGTRYTYGVDTTGRLTNPDDASQTYKWVLQTVEDVHGNSIKYTYTTNGGGNLYPETIVYSDHQNVAALYQVRFVYEDRLAYTSYQRAFKVETNRRLAGIELYERSSGSFQLFRSYQLAYNQVNNAMQHLTSITAKAADNTTLPPVEFTYYDGTEGAEHQLPYLLKSVVSPFGGNTTYEYIPASLLRIEGQPRNFHPFPVQVVTRTIEQSGFGNADVITSYSFEGGHQFYEPADAYQRAYAGFHHATVTQADGSTQHVYHHQSQYSPDNDTSVLQGERLDHISKRGRVYRTEVYNPQLQLVQASIQHWEHQALPTVDATKDRFLVELETAIELAYEGTQTPKATATTYSYDEYGNVLVKHQLGEVTLTSDAGDFTDSLQDDRRTEMQYIENLNDYIVSYPYSRKSTNNGVFYGSEEWYYDGLPLSQASKGLMTTHLQKLQNTKRGGSITTEYEYNNYGLITLQRSPNGHNTTFTYDAHMLYPAVTINPLKHQTLYSYDYRHGIPASVTSPNGAQQAWMYDAYGRVLEERVSNSDAQSLLTKTTYTYNDAATPVLLMVENAITQTVSNNSYYYYDGNGRVVQSRVTSDTPGVYAITTTQYDDQGRPYKTSLPTEVTSTNYSSFTAPSALITETAFDSLDRPLINTTVLGTTTFSYLPWQVQKIDSEAHQLDFITDAYGNTTKVIEHNSGTTYETSYTYDANNNLTEVLDAEGTTRKQFYNFLSWPTAVWLPYKQGSEPPSIISYDYDANGNILTEVRSPNLVTSTTYDTLNRPLTVDQSHTPKTDISYQYDIGDYGIGQLSVVRTPIKMASYGYKPNGFLATEKVTVYEAIESSGKYKDANITLNYEHDPFGPLLNLTTPSGNVAYTYSRNGNVKSVARNGSTIATASYNVAGINTQLTYGNGISTTYNFNNQSLYQLEGLTTQGAGNTFINASFSNDSIGNLLQETDTGLHAKNITYGYDDLYRLTAVDGTRLSNTLDYTYQYSPTGNITQFVSGTDSVVYSYGLNNLPQAATSMGADHSYTYNKDGTMATATMPSEVQTFTYDTLGNLIALETNQQSNKGGGTVTKTREPLTSAKLIPGTITTPIVHKRPPPSSGSSNITEYLLDHQFNRAQKRTGTQRISYIKDFYELDATDERTLYITIGDKKVAQVVDGDVSYFVNDRMGSTAFVVDGSGTVQEELTYEPFGSEVSGTSQPDVARYSYTQQERDSESGLMNYGGRMYNPALRRFLQADPWMGDIRNPQSLNKYSYVMNNPLKYDDPTGEIPVDTVWDAGVTTYDVGRMGVNGLQIIGNELKYGWAKVTGNETMKMNALKGLERDTAQFKEAAIDTAADGAAFAIPYVPAGTTKVIRGADKVTSISNDTKKAIKSVESVPKSISDQIPSGWTGQPSSRGVGWKWHSPNGKNSVRFQTGKSNGWPSQQVPYVKQTNGHSFFNANGNTINATKPSKAPDSHIPASGWQFRTPKK